MLYLDGTRFFFDIENCFSNLVNLAREQNKDVPADKNAKELCSVMARYYGVKPENVRTADCMERALQGIFADLGRVAVPEHDACADMLKSAFPNTEVVVIPKTNDLKLRLSDVADIINEQSVNAVFFSNPCFPTSLEISVEDIMDLAKSVECKIVIDESHAVDESLSIIKHIDEVQNLIVLKKQHFGGKFISVFGNAEDFDSGITAENQAAAKVIFEHDSAIKTAERKLKDSIDSLYIRMKKLAIKYESVERLFRSKADCVFMKVNDAETRGNELKKEGISIYFDKDYFCVFAGDKNENEKVLAALEKILK